VDHEVDRGACDAERNADVSQTAETALVMDMFGQRHGVTVSGLRAQVGDGENMQAATIRA
jgi:hypothetical protein